MSADGTTKEIVVGIKQTKRAIAEGNAAMVSLAKDADPKLTEPLRAMCQLAGIEVRSECTMAELGKSCGIAVGTAACALRRK